MNNKRIAFFLVYIILLVIMLFFNIKAIDVALELVYDNDSYTGDATLYYSYEWDEFDERYSIYTNIQNGAALFDLDKDIKAWKSIFFVPDRVNDQRVKIDSINICNNGNVFKEYNADELLSDYVNVNKSSITANESTSDLSFISTEREPYPALYLYDSFLDSVRNTCLLLICSRILIAVLEVSILMLLVGIISFLLKKYSNNKIVIKTKAIISENKKLCIFNVLMIIVFMLFQSIYSNYNIEVNYKYEISQSQSVLYYNFGDKTLSERFSVYTDIEGNISRNYFSGIGRADGIKIAPNNIVGQAAYVESINVYKNNLLLKNIQAEELRSSYINIPQSNIDAFEDGCIKLTATEENSKPYIVFNENMYELLYSNSFDNILKELIFAIGLIGFLNILLLLYIYGKKNPKIFEARLNTKGLRLCETAILSACIILGWIFKSGIFITITAIGAIIIYAFLKGVNYTEKGKNRIAFSSLAFAALGFIALNSYYLPLYGTDLYYAEYLWFALILTFMSAFYINIFENIDKKGRARLKNTVNDIGGIIIKVLAAVFIYEYIKSFFIWEEPGIAYTVQFMLNEVSQLNLMWIILAFVFIYFLLGKNISNVLASIIYGIVLFGNIIKLKYHSTFLTMADFMQIKDMIAIAPSVIGRFAFYAIIAAVILLLILLLIKIKKVIKHLKPKCNLLCTILLALLVIGYTNQALCGEFSDINLCDKPYMGANTCEATNGVAFFNIYNIKHIKDMNMEKPDNYDEETAEEYAAEFNKLKKDTEDIKPNVICILAESLIDMNNISEISCSEDITPTVHKMKTSSLISPRYGGYTAAVEYEVLTGHSLAFYPSAVIPYTAYYTGNEDVIVPSVPMEFADNGYKTIAIHPNQAQFYNRDRAYEKMGFSEYTDILDFEDPEVVLNNFVKDSEISEKLIDNIENTDEPVFQFAITIEEHYTSAKRYENTEIDITSDKLNQSMLQAMEQQAQAYRHTDEMIAQLKNYIDSCSEPTILYVFGDHLPPLEAFEKLNYVNEDYNRYKTILLGYSNYKEIDLPDMMTPNYLAPQMLNDAGIEHSSYYDYIYSLIEKYPVFHRDYIDLANEEFEKYRYIQYDIMFGNRWFYKGIEHN